MSGRSEIGGVPKVRQWMRLKPIKFSAKVCTSHHLVGHKREYAQPVRVLSSDLACSANIWA